MKGPPRMVDGRREIDAEVPYSGIVVLSSEISQRVLRKPPSPGILLV